MGAVGAISEILSTGLKMLDKHIEDPKRRLEARQEYIDSLRTLADKILLESKDEETDALVIEFVTALHSL